MSVISTLPATPNRIEMVYRYVRQCGARGVSPDDLAQTMSPAALRDSASSPGTAQEVVREASRLGIICLGQDGCYHLTQEVEAWTGSSLLEWLELVLLNPDRAEKADQGEFPLALAWLLEQDVDVPFEFGDNIKDLVERECGADAQCFGLTNRARCQNLVYWAQFLGYAWRLDAGKPEVVMPDPTRALQRHLRTILFEARELLIGELIPLWGVRSSVLEGGFFRVRIADACHKNVHRDPMLLSRSTSLALLRLEGRGVIRLERRADALAYTLDSRPRPRPVSHIVWQEGA